MRVARAWWVGNIAWAALATTAGFSVNQIAGSTRAMAAWFACAFVLRALGNAVAAWAERARVEARAPLPPPPVQELPDWVVDRDQADQVVAAVCSARKRGRTVGITTGLHGAGGFGKSTVARMVRQDKRVQRHFRGRVYWVTVGREVRSRAEIAAKVALETRFITGSTEAFDDPVKAGEHLGRLLEEQPRTLLVLDDIWDVEQLSPFLIGAPQCVRLITTRVPAVLGSGATRILVDRMTSEQAEMVLTWQLPTIESALVSQLVEATGRWPLLVRLANRTLDAAVTTGADINEQARRLLDRLRQGGPTAVDISDVSRRGTLVDASVQAAIGFLPKHIRPRFLELGIFASDEVVPIKTVTWLWQSTGELDEDQSRAICLRLAELSLITLDPARGGGVMVHDVMRDYLRAQMGSRGVTHANRQFVEQVSRHLATGTAPSQGHLAQPAEWWRLDGYMLDHLIEHLIDAEQVDVAEATASDLRWVLVRLRQRGPAAPLSDLGRIPSPRAQQRAHELSQAAHLLLPSDPDHILEDVLHSRLDPLGTWRARTDPALTPSTQPHLLNAWLPPDLPHPGFHRMLVGHTHHVRTVAFSPDGTWLVTAGTDEAVRIWDWAAATFSGHAGSVNAVAVSPNGAWLVTASSDRTARIWNHATGRCTAVLAGHSSAVNAAVISPDSDWLATAGNDKTIRLWDHATGREMLKLTGHVGWIYGLAVSPDGARLASASSDWSVRIWDRVSGCSLTKLTGHAGPVQAVAFSPDGARLVTAGDDRTIRIWNWREERAMTVLTGHTEPIQTVAFSPDGRWIASAGKDRTVRIWESTSGQLTATLTSHTSSVRALAISPHNTWLATVGDDRSVRIWDRPAERITRSPIRNTSSVSALAISRDGTWLASADEDRIIRIWDRESGQVVGTLTGSAKWVRALAINPHGTWLASTGEDRVIRIWDKASGQFIKSTVEHTESVLALAISANTDWLATASGDRTARIWKKSTGLAQLLAGHTDVVHAVTFSPDGTWLATASSDRTVRIWDRATGRTTAVLPDHGDRVLAVAISPDGAWLASGAEDGVVRIWNRTTAGVAATSSEHTGPVHCVAFSPEGRWLASAGSDRTLRIMSVPTGSTVAMMRTESALHCCAWMPDNGELAAGGSRGLYLFRLVEP